METSKLAPGCSKCPAIMPDLASSRESAIPISRDRHEEALKTMAKYHANGNTQDEVIQFEFAEIRASLKQQKDKSKGRYLDLFNTRKCSEFIVDNLTH
jgi:hypothetical protein